MRALLALSLLAATLLAGCNGGGSDHEVTPPQDDGAYQIKATSGNKFAPQHALVPVGSAVEWVVVGASPHNVVAEDGSFTSVTPTKATLREGEKFRHTFASAGEFDYECTLHAGMVGTIHVS